ncbi:MAG: hypothetical protein HY332_20805 [Chloroflexi bacterium]|nr:hypothetical protein [Chloroflexota bacterium]
MPKVYWSDEARLAFEALPPRVQREIDRRLDYVRHFPEMYPVSEQGRYRGFRRFSVMGRHQIVYRVLGHDRNCFVRAIVPARASAD